MKKIFLTLFLCLALAIGAYGSGFMGGGGSSFDPANPGNIGTGTPGTGTFTTLSGSNLIIGATGSISEETNTMTFDDGDGTPVTLQAIRGAIAAGGVDWTADQGATNIHTGNIPDLSGTYLAKAVYDAYSILMATTDDTPVALTVAEQRVVGRVTGQPIAALTLGPAAGNVFQVPADPNATKVLGWNDTSNVAEWVDASGGYTNLTSFIAQTAWRVFYSDGSGDVKELALGTDGEYLKSNGASSAPSWATPSGAAHDAVTLSAGAGTNLLQLSTQEIGLDTQTANYVFAGPTSGGAAEPAFRAMVAADLGTTLAPTFGSVSFGADPADSGALRLSNNTAIGWEQSTPGTDIFVALDSSDVFHVGQNAASISLGTSGTGNVTVVGDLTVTGSDISVGSAGVKLTGDGDGALTILGLGNGYDESLTFNFDDVENTVGITSATGVTTIDASTIELKALKFTSGAADGERYINVDNSAAYRTTGPAEGDISCKADTDTCARYNGSTWVALAFKSDVISQPITGFSSGAGAVAGTDTILQAIQKLDGNIAAKQTADADLTTWAGVTPGTGVGTALAVNVGSSGAVLVNGGVLGTPSSGTLTNATGLPIAGLVASTATALGVGSIELGHASDTSITRVSAGVAAVESKNIVLEGAASGGVVLGDSSPDADGEYGYASNAYLWFANSEDFKVTASANMWTFDSNTSAAFTFTPAVTVTGTLTANGAANIGDGGDDIHIKLNKNTSNATYNGILVNLTCHETIAAGAPVFVNSDGEAALANATAASTMPAIGVAAVGGNASDTCTILTHGVMSATAYPTFSPGNTVYVDDSAAGVLTATVGDVSGTDHVVQIIGVALGADTILVNPSLSTITLE